MCSGGIDPPQLPQFESIRKTGTFVNMLVGCSQFWAGLLGFASLPDPTSLREAEYRFRNKWVTLARC